MLHCGVCVQGPESDDPNGVEAKVYSFVQWAIQNLEAHAPELTNKDAEGNYQVSCALIAHDAST